MHSIEFEEDVNPNRFFLPENLLYSYIFQFRSAFLVFGSVEGSIRLYIVLFRMAKGFFISKRMLEPWNYFEDSYQSYHVRVFFLLLLSEARQFRLKRMWLIFRDQAHGELLSPMHLILRWHHLCAICLQFSENFIIIQTPWFWFVLPLLVSQFPLLVKFQLFQL